MIFSLCLSVQAGKMFEADLFGQAEDGETTEQGRREPPGTGKQQAEGNGRL